MTNLQIQGCTDLLARLFDQWKPNSDQLQEWGGYFSKFTVDRVTTAIRQMFRGKSTSHAPKPKEFWAIITQLKSTEGSEKQLPEANAWLICSGLDEDNKGFPGMVSWLGWWGSRLEPMGSSAEAQKAIEEHQAVYGGRWICFCGPGPAAMLKAQHFKRSVA